ncbi:MAG: hypothetical protein CMF39_04590 [Legionellaceae bacterium]|mgnify:CR=1 FL=1|nr:hypothetical protein [Legionellaceae bacterium]
MELTLDNNRASWMITSVKPGEIKVNDETITKSVLISPRQLIANWSVQSFADITLDHLQPIAALAPDIVILGSGHEPHLLPAKLMSFFLEQGIGIECMNTPAACRTFNVLMSEGRNAVAGLII